jgi:hypothetical protein
MVYSVPPEELRRALGSRSTDLKKAMGLGKDPQSAAAERFIDAGAVTGGDPGVRIHAFEKICAHLGRLLPNGSVSPVRLEFLDVVDEELQRLGFALSLNGLIYGGGPLGLPPADDFPSVGHAEAERVARAEVQRREGLLDRIEGDAEDVMMDLSDWVEISAARKDMLVGFCY